MCIINISNKTGVITIQNLKYEYHCINNIQAKCNKNVEC